MITQVLFLGITILSIAFLIGFIIQTRKVKVFEAKKYRYPVAFHTVDCAIIRNDLQTGKRQVLLVRKPGLTVWQFCGGFLDPTDASAEAGALREAREETGMEVAEPKYICSIKIDDVRYRTSEHKIITSFFEVKYIYGAAGKGFDDIEETRWFFIDEVNVEKDLRDIHQPLFVKYRESLSKQNSHVN